MFGAGGSKKHITMKIFGILLLTLSALLNLTLATVSFCVEYGPVVGLSFLSFILFIVGVILIKLDKKNTDS